MMTSTGDASTVIQIGSTGQADFDANNRALNSMVNTYQTNLSQGVIDPNMLDSSEATIKEGVQQQRQLSNGMVHLLALYKEKTTTLAAAKTAISSCIAAAHGFAAQDAAANAAANAAADEEKVKMARSILAAAGITMDHVQRAAAEE